MDAREIAAILDKKPRGGFFTIVCSRNPKLKRGSTDVVEKVSRFQGKLADYVKRKPVREAVEAGERDAPELPKYVSDSFKVGLTKFWRGNNGNEYLPVCIDGNGAKVQWYLNGQPCAKDDVKHLLHKDELRERESKSDLEGKGQAQFCCVTLSNVAEIH